MVVFVYIQKCSINNNQTIGLNRSTWQLQGSLRLQLPFNEAKCEMEQDLGTVVSGLLPGGWAGPEMVGCTVFGCFYFGKRANAA